MGSVKIITIIFIICLIVGVISFISIIKNTKNRTFSITSLLLAVLGIAISALSFNLPVPTIYPLNNELERTDRLAISILSEAGVQIYYSTDGSEPKDGVLYTGSFDIDCTTTISARSKYLFFWSDEKTMHYIIDPKFDNLDNQATNAAGGTEPEDDVRIAAVRYLSSDTANRTVVLSVDVVYNLDSQDKGMLMLHGNYLDENIWTGISDADIIIEKGYGKHTFEIEVYAPDWSTFSLRAYIHPFPIPQVEYNPITYSKDMDFDISAYFY